MDINYIYDKNKQIQFILAHVPNLNQGLGYLYAKKPISIEIGFSC
ncbi:hypothetical protein STFR1_10024 [Bacillus vallismortis]